MASLNEVRLIGNLGSDPEVRALNEGSLVASVSIATTDTWIDKASHEKKEKTEWHRVVFYKGLAEIVEKYLKTGSQVYIAGKLRTRKWTDKDQIDRYTTEIIATEMKMLDKKQSVGAPTTAHSAPSSAKDFDDIDDDTPF